MFPKALCSPPRYGDLVLKSSTHSFSLNRPFGGTYTSGRVNVLSRFYFPALALILSPPPSPRSHGCAICRIFNLSLNFCPLSGLRRRSSISQARVSRLRSYFLLLCRALFPSILKFPTLYATPQIILPSRSVASLVSF